MTERSHPHIAKDITCPACAQVTGYDLERPKGTLRARLFPALFVLETTLQVTCRACGARSAPDVAMASGISLEALAFRQACALLLAGMAGADAEIGPEERDLLVDVLERLGVEAQDAQRLLQPEVLAELQGADMLASLSSYLPYLSLRSRCNLLEAAFHMARIDDRITKGEIGFLQKVSIALRIPIGEFDILMDLAEQKDQFFEALVAHFDELQGTPPHLPDGVVLQR